MENSADIVIVGAGAAGCTAAAEIARTGLSVVVFEARDRVGGRIFTHRDPVSQVPVEFGAEFVHGLAPEIWKPLQAQGVDISEVRGDQWCRRKGQLSRCDFFAQVDQILQRMDARFPDESFSSFLKQCCPDSESDPEERQAKSWALGYVTGFNAADPDRVGVHWLVEGMQADAKIEGDRTFRCANGYEDLLQIFRHELATANVAIQTNSVVRSVKWRQDHAEIEVQRENELRKFTARCVLVTLPLGVLRAAAGAEGGIHFEPELPRRKVDAMQKMEMGKVVRVTLRFQNRFWDRISPNAGDAKTLSGMSFLFSQDDWFPTWWTAGPKKVPIITGWAPSMCAERLSGASHDHVIEQSLKSLGSLLKVSVSELAGLLDVGYFHNWQSDPFSRGAYTYGTVGSDGSQKELGEPVDNTLFFAGEATDVTGHNGTVHGAIASGHRAAREILMAFDRGSNSAARN